MAPASFDDFKKSLSDLRGPIEPDESDLRASAEAFAAALAALEPLEVGGIAGMLQEHPAWTPIVASCIGLSQEQLKNALKFWFGTTSWRKLVRDSGHALVARLDAEYALLERLVEQRARAWSFADILVERSLWSRGRASGSIGRGRHLESQVQDVIIALGLTPSMRTRFSGRDGRSAPCDFKIQNAQGVDLIVGAAKGYNSTGSKLTDAVREIEQMADVRLPRQFVFAVVDGIGWLSREADLRRIFDLRVSERIDGLYTVARLAELGADLAESARLRGLLP